MDSEFGLDQQRAHVPGIANEGPTAPRPVKLTLRDLHGIVPAIPGRDTGDFEDQIEEAMEEEAARIVAGM